MRQAGEMSHAQVQWPRPDSGVNAVRLPEAGRVLIGRRPEASVRIEGDGEVSREHAELSCLEGVWLIDDLDSTGGTYLIRASTSAKVTGRRRLRHGDHIRVGATTLKFQCPPDPQNEVVTERARADDIVLTPRERDVLAALCAQEVSNAGGWPSNIALARALNISRHTVRSHLQALYGKFGLETLPFSQRKARLVRRAIDEGWAGGNG